MTNEFLQKHGKVMIASGITFFGILISYIGVVTFSTIGVTENVSAVINNGAAAVDQFGQYDNDNTTTLVNAFTKPIQSFGANTLTRVGIEIPSGLALDSVHHRLFVADTNNKRVLVHNLNPDNTLPDRIPDLVLGQSSFNTETASVSISGLTSPVGLAYDATGDRLFVADSTVNRVLVYDTAAITNGEDAIFVLGQGGFTTSTSVTSATGMRTPLGLAFDPAGRLFVADSVSNRVLVHDTTALSNGQAAAFELGQPAGGAAFTSSAAATTATGMSAPSGVLYDAANTRLYVVDKTNNRVTIFDVNSGTIANGQAATNFIGQPNFTTGTVGTTSQKFSAPRDAALDVTGNRLFVADSTNNRVLVFDVATITDDPVAINVLGQSLFTTATAATTQSGMKAPLSLEYDATNNLLFTAESTNHRIIVHDVTGAITDGEDAVNEIGQVDANNPDPFAADVIYTKGDTNANPTRVTHRGDSMITFDLVHHRAFFIDRFNERLLVFNLDSTNHLIDKVPDFVLGQPDFNAISTTQITTSTSVWLPFGTAYDPQGDRLYVADTGNHRVLVFDTSTITNGEAAAFVLGQADFVTGTTHLSIKGFNTPTNPFFDGTNQRLYVTDDNNHRVMIFDVANLTDNQDAEHVIGQPDFVTNTAATAQDRLNGPGEAVLDIQRNRLFVTDSSHRILVFDTTAIDDGEPAVNVLGQPDFTSSGFDLNAKGFRNIGGLDYDSVGNRLFVGDFINQRVLVFDVASITDNEDATHVLGQADFVTSVIAVTQSSLQLMNCAEFNQSTQQAFVCDPRANRIMIFDASALFNDEDNFCPTPIATIQTPNDSSIFNAGDTKPFNFSYNGCNVDSFVVTLIDGDTTFPVTLTNSAHDASTGTAQWTVPNISTTQGRLKVDLLSADGSVLASDTSDNDLTIVGNTTTEVPTGTTTPPSPGAALSAKQLFINEVSPDTINENLGFTADTQPVTERFCISNTLIKNAASSTVYYCAADARRYVFINEKSYFSWYPDFSRIILMSDDTLSKIPVGGNVNYKPKQRMIKIQNDPKVYGVSRYGVLHLMTTEAVAQEIYGSNWNTQIDDIPEAFLVSYTVGEQLE